jgi:hypothetical protein
VRNFDYDRPASYESLLLAALIQAEETTAAAQLLVR